MALIGSRIFITDVVNRDDQSHHKILKMPSGASYNTFVSKYKDAILKYKTRTYPEMSLYRGILTFKFAVPSMIYEPSPLSSDTISDGYVSEGGIVYGRYTSDSSGTYQSGLFYKVSLGKYLILSQRASYGSLDLSTKAYRDKYPSITIESAYDLLTKSYNNLSRNIHDSIIKNYGYFPGFYYYSKYSTGTITTVSAVINENDGSLRKNDTTPKLTSNTSSRGSGSGSSTGGSASRSTSTRSSSTSSSSSSGLSSSPQGPRKFNCYFYTLVGGSAQVVYYLPVYPNEFSDSNHAEFSSSTPLGRSVAYQNYNTSSRSCSFTLQLHEELCDDYSYIHRLVAMIQSACYPSYSTNIVKPPEICFVIGKQFKIRGILTDCSAQWKAPIIDDNLVNCDLSIGIQETTGPYSKSTIASKGGYRG